MGQSIKSASDLNALLLAAKDKEIVFIDEVHELPKVHQTALYLALDKRQIVVNSGKSFQSLPLAEFTLLLGSTDEYCLLQPLRDRMRLLLQVRVLHRRGTDQDRHAPSQVAAMGPGRAAAAPDRPTSQGNSTSRPAAPASVPACLPCRGEENLTLHHLRTACELERLDELGLGPTERKYLRALAEGASRLNVIASMLGLPTRTLSAVIEPFLLRAGLISRTMTAEGSSPVPGRIICCRVRKVSNFRQSDVQLSSNRCPMCVQKQAVSVAEMARMVGLSRARFYQLLGIRLPVPALRRGDEATLLPARTPGGVPRRQAAELRHQRQAGHVPQAAKGGRPPQPEEAVSVETAPDDSRCRDWLTGLRSLGLAGVTAEQVGRR